MFNSVCAGGGREIGGQWAVAAGNWKGERRNSMFNLVSAGGKEWVEAGLRGRGG
jgi:hypothetical protein